MEIKSTATEMQELLDAAALVFNSVLCRLDAKFMMIGLVNLCLVTLMKDYEHLCIKLQGMPQEIINEH